MIEKNTPEYDIVKKLNKIGLFFKYLFFLILFLIITYSVYIFTFNLDKPTADGERNKYKKAIINISFSSKRDFELSKNYLRNYDEILYNKTKSKLDFKLYNYSPIYQINIKTKGSLFSLNPNFHIKDLYKKDSFYFFRHYQDETAYTRGDVFLPKLEELYSGKLVFESFFKTSYLDFINLVAGIIASDDLYAYKYSEQIKKIVFQTIKKRKSYLISSYNNKDSSTHKNLLKAYSVYYLDDDLKLSLLNGRYYLANELVADARYFNFQLKGNEFQFNINFKEKVFSVFIFRNGNLINRFKQLHFNTKLKSGLYNVVILKEEDTLFGKRELFWIYLNFKI